jgi:hypothetical protein
VADAVAESQSGDAGAGDDASQHHQTIFLGGPVQFIEEDPVSARTVRVSGLTVISRMPDRSMRRRRSAWRVRQSNDRCSK